MPTDRSRRRFLRTCSLPLAAGIAGCGGLLGNPGSQNGPTPSESLAGTTGGTDTETATKSPTDRTATDVDCQATWSAESRWQRQIEGPIGETGWATRWNDGAEHLQIKTESEVIAITPSADVGWRRSLDRGSVAAWTDDRIVLYGAEQVRAVALPGTETQWTFAADEQTTHRVAAAGDRLYVFATKYPNKSQNFEETFTRLYALDVASGDIVWRLDEFEEPYVNWEIHAAADHVYLKRRDGPLLVVGPDRAITRRPDPLDGATIDRWGPVHDDLLPVMTDADGVFVLSTSSGEVQWHRWPGDAILGTFEGRLVLAEQVHRAVRVFALDATTGRDRWEVELEGRTPVNGAVRDGVAYVETRTAETADADGMRLSAVVARTGCVLGSVEATGAPAMEPTFGPSSVYWPVKQGDAATLSSFPLA